MTKYTAISLSTAPGTGTPILREDPSLEKKHDPTDEVDPHINNIEPESVANGVHEASSEKTIHGYPTSANDRDIDSSYTKGLGIG